MSAIGKFFGENGYYFAKGIYSTEEVTAMESDFDRVVDQLLKSDENVNARWDSSLTDALDGGESVIIHTYNIQGFSAVWMQAFLCKLVTMKSKPKTATPTSNWYFVAGTTSQPALLLEALARATFQHLIDVH